jgi:hypothetical protein
VTYRQTLPDRRRCESLDFEHARHKFSLTASRYLKPLPANAAVSGGNGVDRTTAWRPSLDDPPSAHQDHDGGPVTLLGAALHAIDDAIR